MSTTDITAKGLETMNLRHLTGADGLGPAADLLDEAGDLEETEPRFAAERTWSFTIVIKTATQP